MKPDEKAIIAFFNHNEYPSIVYRMRQSILDFLSLKSKENADFPASMTELQEQGIVFQMNDANPDFGEPYQAAFFVGAQIGVEVTTGHPLENGLAFLFEWLSFKTKQQEFARRETPAVAVHNLCGETDELFMPYLANFKHTIDKENVMQLSVWTAGT